MMAIDAANEGNGIPGYKLEPLILDDGTATAGQYDPAQAATNAASWSPTRMWWRAGAADERRRQGDGADPEPGRSGDHHADLDQSGHLRPEIRRAVSVRRASRSISAP